jgi:uncharacterized membrane protein YjjB (DUF3815 family)
MEVLKQFIFSFLSTIGFAVLFSSPKESIGKSGFVGATGWVVYFLTYNLLQGKVAGTFCAALSVGILGEILARYYKKPATVYIIPGIVPLVPGAGMYYTMLALVEKDFLMAANTGTETLFIAASISVGIIISTTLSKSIKRVRQKD